MKTAIDTLEEISPNRPWRNGGKTDAMIIRAMQIYAQSAIDEIKEKIAEEAMVECVDWDKHVVDKESIRSVTIELK